MRRFIDLHTHSTASDGMLPPEQLLALAEAKRLAAVALTDHDTTAGLAAARRAASRYPKLCFVPGIEVSALFPQGTLHILGLDIDEGNRRLQGMLSDLRGLRNDRNPRILARLRELGVDLRMEDVLAVAGRDPKAGAGGESIISRVHMAEALRRKGYVRSRQEAFDKYIGSGAPAYVEKDRMPPGEIISAILAAGGVAALAHPPQLKYGNLAEFERILRGLIHCGLNCLEVYHSEHSQTQTREYLRLARKYKLEVSGGSDFHGSPKAEVRLGRPRVPLAALSGQLGQRLSAHP